MFRDTPGSGFGLIRGTQDRGSRLIRGTQDRGLRMIRGTQDRHPGLGHGLPSATFSCCLRRLTHTAFNTWVRIPMQGCVILNTHEV